MDNFIEDAHKDIQRLIEITSTITNLDRNLQQLKTENEAYKVLRQRQEEIIMNQANEIDQWKQKHENLSGENQKLNEIIAEKDQLIKELRERIAELEEIKQKTEENLKQMEERCNKLEEDKKSLEEQVSQQAQKQSQAEQEFSEYKQKMEEDLKQMEEKGNKLEDEKKLLEEQATKQAQKQAQTEQVLQTLQVSSQEEKQQLLEELALVKSQSSAFKEIPSAETLSAQEAQVYIEMLNSVLKDDSQLLTKMPLDASDPESLYPKLKDGVILCKFLNRMMPHTIDPRAINIKEPLEEEHQLQNLNMAISGAKSHGCMLGSMTSEDIYNEKQEHVLNMIWQISRAALINTINVQNCPNLLTLKENEENQESFIKLPPEEMLIRWMNNHLKTAHMHRTITNFSTDLKDGEILLGLTNFLEKYQWSTDANNTQKIKKSIKSAQAMGTETLVRPEPVASAHPKLGLLFCAQLFKAVPGLKMISEDESKELATLIQGQDEGDSREFIKSISIIQFFRERTFRMWLNSLALNNIKYLTNLYEDISDGLVLLKVLDYMQPGCVNWDKVQKNPNHFLQKTANCNMFMEIAKKSLGLQLVAIGSEDILNKNKKLVLAIFWQLMIRDVMKTIGDLKETDLVKWANERVGDKEPKIKNLKDPNIKNCVFLFNLLSAINPKLIDWSIVQEDESPESLKSNAQYTISIVRKLGASLFLVWEDIIDLKTKMIMTLFASLKSYDKGK